MNDSSLALYRCPFCPLLSRDRDEVLDHIEETTEGAHAGMDRGTLDRPIPELFPTIKECPFGDWAEAIRDFARASDEIEEGDTVNYRAVAETLGLPKSYISYHLDKLGYEVTSGSGYRKISASWDQLTDKQQHTLLAWAYFPEYTHDELAEMDYSGHETQSTISKTIREHGWMLSHPGIDTPVYPTEQKDDRGEVEFEGDTEEMLEDLERIVPGEAEEPDEEAMEGAGAPSSTPEPRGERTKEADPEPEPGDEGGSGMLYATLGKDMAYETMCSFIETGRYEEARMLFEQVAENQPVDLRWEGSDE